MAQAAEIERIKLIAFGQECVPELFAELFGGAWKMNDVLKTTQHGGINIIAQVGGEDAEAVVFFDALQQVTCFEVGPLVVRVAYLCAFAEEGMGGW